MDGLKRLGKRRKRETGFGHFDLAIHSALDSIAFILALTLFLHRADFSCSVAYLANFHELNKRVILVT